MTYKTRILSRDRRITNGDLMKFEGPLGHIFIIGSVAVHGEVFLQRLTFWRARINNGFAQERHNAEPFASSCRRVCSHFFVGKLAAQL